MVPLIYTSLPVKFKSAHVTGMSIGVTIFVCGELSAGGSGVGLDSNVGAGVATVGCSTSMEQLESSRAITGNQNSA